MLVALVLRLYRLPELTPFIGDQGRESIVLDTMIRTGQPVLTGPIVSSGSYMRGPAYYYLMAPGFALGGDDPAAGAIMIALADTATVVLLALLGRALGGWIVGLTAAALWATGALTVALGRIMWNPQWVPIFELICLFAMVAVARGRPRWFLAAGPALGLGWQMHDQFVIFGVVVPLWCVLARPAVSWRLAAASFALGVVTTLPFLSYEVTHGFADILGMISQVAGLGGGPPRPGIALGDKWGSILAAGDQFMPGSGHLELGLWVLAGIGIAACLRRAMSRDDAGGPIALLLLIAIVPLYLFWPGPLIHYYMYIVGTALLLLVGLGASWLWRWRRPVGAVACLLVAVVAADSGIGTLEGIRDRPTLQRGTLAASRSVIAQIASDQGDRPFSVRLVSSYAGTDSYDAPFFYLLGRAAGPASGRVDLPTVVIFDPADQDGGASFGGRLVGGARIVGFEAPELGPELASDGDVAVAGSVSPVWGPPDPGVQAASDGTRGNVRLVVRPDEPPPPYGRTIAQPIAVGGPGRYLVRFEARTDLSSGTGRVIAETRDAAGTWLGVAPDGAGIILPAGPGWSVGSFFVDAPDGAARIVVYLRNSGVGSVDIRGVSVRRVVSAILPGAAIY